MRAGFLCLEREGLQSWSMSPWNKHKAVVTKWKIFIAFVHYFEMFCSFEQDWPINGQNESFALSCNLQNVANGENSLFVLNQ